MLEIAENGQPEITSIGNLVEWFLDFDPRVATIRSSAVEEIFQWKQAESARAQENVFGFNRAEDRLVIGIMQALALNDTEQTLHEWISQLLNALDDATKTNAEIGAAHGMVVGDHKSPLSESGIIPDRKLREVFLNCVWLQALCTAEVRVLGWVYQELYKKPFSTPPTIQL